MSAPPLAAVTGGTGFLGRPVVAALLAQGWRVRQLIRTPRDTPGETVEGTLRDEPSLHRLVEGADLVVHMAALVRSPDVKGFGMINVAGAANLGRAIRARALGAHVVVVSSLAAREPTLSPYAASKAAGEIALLEAAEPSSYAVLRPCALYGPRDRATLPVFRAARLPVMPIPRRPQARMALLHVEDAARAVVAACDREVGQVQWEVGEGAYGWTHLARAAARALGRDPALLAVPDGLLAAAVALARWVAAGSSPMTSPGKLAELLHGDWTCDPALLPPPRRWRPSMALAEGFAGTARWYRDHGWL